MAKERWSRNQALWYLEVPAVLPIDGAGGHGSLGLHYRGVNTVSAVTAAFLPLSAHSRSFIIRLAGREEDRAPRLATVCRTERWRQSLALAVRYGPAVLSVHGAGGYGVFV